MKLLIPFYTYMYSKLFDIQKDIMNDSHILLKIQSQL